MSVETVRELLEEAEALEDIAHAVRAQAAKVIFDEKLCARGGDPTSNGRGFCCGRPYDCLGRQP